MLRSLKFRLTFLYVGIFALFVGAFSLGVHALAASRVWKEFDKDLERDARVYASLIVEERQELRRGEHTEQNWLDELKGYPNLMHSWASLYAGDGRLLYRSEPVEAWPGRVRGWQAGAPESA